MVVRATAAPSSTWKTDPGLQSDNGRFGAHCFWRKKREDAAPVFARLLPMPASKAILAACRHIEGSSRPPSLDDLAAIAAMSRFHFQRTFRAEIGITPRQFAAALRDKRVREALSAGLNIQSALVDSGFGSSSRFYDRAHSRLGMSPSQYHDKGRDAVIRLSVGECSLGGFLVAASEKGVCQVSLGNDLDHLMIQAQERFKNARIMGPDRVLDDLVVRVVALLDGDAMDPSLPLDIRGTVFQQQVWSVLREIPKGQALSYAEVAQRLGRPHAHRAVASACAANHLAVLIPCHRVVKTDGSVSGYRWGVERKLALLSREGVVPAR